MPSGIVEAVAIAVAVALTVGAASAAVEWFRRRIAALHRVVMDELTPNSGASMRDRLAKVERQSDTISEAVRELAIELRRQSRDNQDGLRAVHERVDDVFRSMWGGR